MKRAFYALVTALGTVKLGAPVSLAVVALARPIPHVLAAPMGHVRGAPRIEAAEAFVARTSDSDAPTAVENKTAPVRIAGAAGVESPATDDARAFDAAQAQRAVMRSMESLPICRRDDGTGPGVAEITWAADGSVASVALAPPYVTSPARGCIARRFEQAVVAPYDGQPQTMRVRFSL